MQTLMFIRALRRAGVNRLGGPAVLRLGERECENTLALRDPRQQGRGDLSIDKQGFGRAAHRHSAEFSVADDLGGEARDVLEEHRLPLAVGADDEVVERQRQLDDRVKSGEAAVARELYFDWDARVAGAEEVHEAVRPGLDPVLVHVDPFGAAAGQSGRFSPFGFPLMIKLAK